MISLILSTLLCLPVTNFHDHLLTCLLPSVFSITPIYLSYPPSLPFPLPPSLPPSIPLTFFFYLSHSVLLSLSFTLCRALPLFHLNITHTPPFTTHHIHCTYVHHSATRACSTARDLGFDSKQRPMGRMWLPFRWALFSILTVSHTDRFLYTTPITSPQHLFPVCLVCDYFVSYA